VTTIIPGPTIWFMAAKNRTLNAKQVVGHRLRVLRAALNLQQQELAEIMGLSQQTISGWENGRDTIDPLALARFATQYGIGVNWIWLGLLNDIPSHLAEEIRRRRPDLIAGAAPATEAPAPGWDKVLRRKFG